MPAGKGVGVWLGGEVEKIWEGRENHNQNIFYGKNIFSIKEVKYHKKNQILKILKPRTKRGDSWVSILYSETVHICKF